MRHRAAARHAPDIHIEVKGHGMTATRPRPSSARGAHVDALPARIFCHVNAGLCGARVQGLRIGTRWWWEEGGG
jgi:hypothetical protein